MFSFLPYRIYNLRKFYIIFCYYSSNFTSTSLGSIEDVCGGTTILGFVDVDAGGGGGSISGTVTVSDGLVSAAAVTGADDVVVSDAGVTGIDAAAVTGADDVVVSDAGVTGTVVVSDAVDVFVGAAVTPAFVTAISRSTSAGACSVTHRESYFFLNPISNKTDITVGNVIRRFLLLSFTANSKIVFIVNSENIIVNRFLK
jgi:hypothetical protein